MAFTFYGVFRRLNEGLPVVGESALDRLWDATGHDKRSRRDLFAQMRGLNTRKEAEVALASLPASVRHAYEVSEHSYL